MILNQGDVIRRTDGTHVLITFPTDPEDPMETPHCWVIDALECDEYGELIDPAYTVGSPTRTEDFEVNLGQKEDLQ